MSTDADDGASEWVTGLFMYALRNASTSPSRVALNNKRWLPGLVRSKISRTIGMKPMSAIWSASSSTVISTLLKSTDPRSARSIKRPGVATSMCTPRSRASICFAYGIPPAIKRRRSSAASAIGRRVSLTCIANSRVGTKIKLSG